MIGRGERIGLGIPWERDGRYPKEDFWPLRWVGDLMRESGGGWNKELIDRLFILEFVARIKEIKS